MKEIMIARDAILDDLRRRFFENDKAVKALDPKQSHHWFEPMKQKNCFQERGKWRAQSAKLASCDTRGRPITATSTLPAQLIHACDGWSD